MATSIEWTEETWNPVAGCSIVSSGCTQCYAMKMAARLEAMGQAKYIGLTQKVNGNTVWTGDVRLDAAALEIPLGWRKPRRVFVNSMSDLFHEKVGDAFLDFVFAVMAVCQEHSFQVLTKRPERMQSYMQRAFATQPTVNCIELDREGDRIHSSHGPGYAWPLPNVWLGVSAENQETADSRIPLLLQTPAAVRFVSYEPALEGVDFSSYLTAWCDECAGSGETSGHYSSPDNAGPCEGCGGNGIERYAEPPLSWLIVGGESGPGARPFDLRWAERVVADCKAAGVPVFCKQLGARPFMSPEHEGATGYEWPISDRKGAKLEEWPEHLRVREFPAGVGT